MKHIAITWTAAVTLLATLASSSPPRSLNIAFDVRAQAALPPKLPICVPPEVTAPLGVDPPSAVTTVQTGGASCTQYGNAPAEELNDLQSPNGLQSWVEICRGQIVTMQGSNGKPRKACFYANPASTKEKPLPLLVWLNPSLVGATLSFPLTGIHEARTSQALNNEDPSRSGFSYILPFGRNTRHQYPVPDDVGLGWDNWYRNLDRSSSTLNTDVDFIDKSIAYAKAHIPVDARRVYMSGWSNGAAMAELYALNTDGIAAASVYSAPDPYRDSQDVCTQVPKPKFATPTRDIHNFCDILGICTTGKYFHDDLRTRYPNTKRSVVVLDVVTTAIKSSDAQAKCETACQSPCGLTSGTVAHLRWPVLRNSDTYFAYMRNNPLPTSGSWGPPS